MTRGARNPSRRTFLLAAGAGSAATAAALLAKRGATSAAKMSQPGSPGYRVSEHVNNYYRTTRI